MMSCFLTNKDLIHIKSAPSSQQLLANASHDQLICVGNPAHTQLYHEFLKVIAKAETLE